jgi:hypothetical protein
MSNNPNSQLIKAVTSINVHQQKNGDFFVKAQIIEDAAHMQVPNVKINSQHFITLLLKIIYSFLLNLYRIVLTTNLSAFHFQKLLCAMSRFCINYNPIDSNL